jgi:hypothetical protein
MRGCSPAKSTPVARTPVASTPVASTPVASTPVASTTVLRKPGTSTPVNHMMETLTNASNFSLRKLGYISVISNCVLIHLSCLHEITCFKFAGQLSTSKGHFQQS